MKKAIMSKDKSVDKAKFTSYQIIVVALLALTQFSVVLDFLVISPLGYMVMKSMSLSPNQFGLAVSVYAFSAGVSGLLTAGFADRFDRKKLLLFFYIGFILGTLACGLTISYPMLIAARLITGFFGGVIGSISMSIVVDLFPMYKRGRAMGFMMMGLGASQVLGIPISLYLANIWGWQSPFLMIASLAVIIWVLILVKMRPVTENLNIKSDRNAFSHLWHTAAKRKYQVGFLSTLFLSIGGFMMMPWGSTFAINNLRVTPDQLPYLFFVGGLSSLIVMPLIGNLADKMDKFKLFVLASIWMILTVVVYTNLLPISFWIIMLMYALMMLGIMSRVTPSMALSSDLPEPQDRGAYMAINSSLQQIAGGVTAIAGGLILVQKDNFSPIEHYDTVGYVIAIISLVNIFFVFRVNKLLKKNNAN
jgi:predicted MFS family arabinose efflux permease